jgi:starch-binding outer membrane protein, SusD/RagB family
MPIKIKQMKKQFIYIFTTIVVLAAGCTKLDFKNINAPTIDQVLTTREGLITLSIGMKQYYSTNGLQTLLLTPGTTAREVKGITTFTNILEIEAGGTALPTFNGNVLGVWRSMLRTMSMAEDLISNAPVVLESDINTQTGIVAFGKLFKAMSIAGLATSFEQLPVQTDETGNASFVTRVAGLQEAVKLLDEAITAIGATPPSAEFNTRVLGADIVFADVINAYRARYNMMLGNYAAALAAANAVNLATKSQFVYSDQSPNPVYQQVAVSANYRPRADFGLPAGFVDPADGRLSFYLSTPDAVVGGETLKTLKGFFDAINKAIPFYLPDEMRLLKAEALIRSNGSIPNAIVEINAVRTQSSGDPFGVHANLPVYAGAITPDALLLEIYRQRSAELFLQGLRLEDSRRFARPAPPTNVNPVPVTFERNRNFYPYPDQERLTNPNTPTDPAI